MMMAQAAKIRFVSLKAIAGKGGVRNIEVDNCAISLLQNCFVHA
jgi:hypothetical protein